MAPRDLMRRTKIVATIGPATESPEMLRKLILAGATTLRLNFSHGDHSDHADRIATIRQVAHELGVHVGILQDLQGPKIRLGRFEGGPITLANGDAFTLTSREVKCNETIATVTYARLADEVKAGSRILLDDGRVEMVAERVDQVGQSLHCRVTVGGVLSNNKGVNFPDVQLSIRALTPKDRRDLAFGLQNGVDWVALELRAQSIRHAGDPGTDSEPGLQHPGGGQDREIRSHRRHRRHPSPLRRSDGGAR